MDIVRFNSMVARLETESARFPQRYRVKVALLAMLGFAILGVVLAAVGAGLVALAAIVIALATAGSGVLLLLLAKLGKLIFLLAVPLWFILKSAIQALFVRLPAPRGREVVRSEAPALFAALDEMRTSLRGPRFHHVLVVNEVNAAVVQRPAFGLVGWPRNYLLLGLPLLECVHPDEAMAIVAHEYGHLAGSHGRFSAFIYRLRHTWDTLQAYLAHFEGPLAKAVTPLVRWYAPYFNAYTHVLARADEYHADAAASDLVGAGSARHALKRVNLAAPRFNEFMERTFERVDEDPAPPADLLQRWSVQSRAEAETAAQARWLEQALDREGHYLDTHPTLRARLNALQEGADTLAALPPAIVGDSAGQAFFGGMLDRLRTELQAGWVDEVAPAWTARHAEVQQARQRLQELRALVQRDVEQELELFGLALRLEPDSDMRGALAAFNAAHPANAHGLYLEALVRLAKGEREGLDLLERVMALDPEATPAACERAHAFLAAHEDEALRALADDYVQRWRRYQEGA